MGNVAALRVLWCQVSLSVVVSPTTGEPPLQLTLEQAGDVFRLAQSLFHAKQYAQCLWLLQVRHPSLLGLTVEEQRECPVDDDIDAVVRRRGMVTHLRFVCLAVDCMAEQAKWEDIVMLLEGSVEGAGVLEAPPLDQASRVRCVALCCVVLHTRQGLLCVPCCIVLSPPWFPFVTIADVVTLLWLWLWLCLTIRVTMDDAVVWRFVPPGCARSPFRRLQTSATG